MEAGPLSFNIATEKGMLTELGAEISVPGLSIGVASVEFGGSCTFTANPDPFYVTLAEVSNQSMTRMLFSVHVRLTVVFAFGRDAFLLVYLLDPYLQPHCLFVSRMAQRE
jgi:hypothetical protein